MMSKLIQRLMYRRTAYRRLFLDQDNNMRPDAEVVLADLRRFCRAQGSTAIVSPISKSIDPIAMAMAEGRREVWNRILAHLYLEDKTVFTMKDPTVDQE